MRDHLFNRPSLPWINDILSHILGPFFPSHLTYVVLYSLVVEMIEHLFSPNINTVPVQNCKTRAKIIRLLYMHAYVICIMYIYIGIYRPPTRKIIQNYLNSNSEKEVILVYLKCSWKFKFPMNPHVRRVCWKIGRRFVGMLVGWSVRRWFGLS